MAKIYLDDPALLAYAQTLPAFESYPYTVIRVSPALYQILLMPAELAQPDLYALAWTQERANRLEMALVLGADAAFWFGQTGEGSFSNTIPRGGNIASHGFLPAWDCVPDEAHSRRVEALRGYEAARNAGGGYLFGDLTKGGRPATPDELRRLAGCNSSGVPNGLHRCPHCQYWAGYCLDPSPEFAGQVMSVDCLCANHNRCARCGQLLYSHKLNANYFDESDGQIWHVAGFSGFQHECTRRMNHA